MLVITVKMLNLPVSLHFLFNHYDIFIVFKSLVDHLVYTCNGQTTVSINNILILLLDKTRLEVFHWLFDWLSLITQECFL